MIFMQSRVMAHPGGSRPVRSEVMKQITFALSAFSTCSIFKWRSALPIGTPLLVGSVGHLFRQLGTHFPSSKKNGARRSPCPPHSRTSSTYYDLLTSAAKAVEVDSCCGTAGAVPFPNLDAKARSIRFLAVERCLLYQESLPGSAPCFAARSHERQSYSSI